MAKRVGNSQASRDLGTTETSIRNWRKKLNPTPKSLLKEENKKSYRELEKENKRLKKEFLYRKSYTGERELRSLVFEYIEVW